MFSCHICRQKFRVYVHRVKFTVVTNHSSPYWLQTLSETEGQLARWAIALQAYNFEIIHRPGSSHQNADCLSRLPTIAALSPVADRLYDLILTPNLWSNEP